MRFATISLTTVLCIGGELYGCKEEGQEKIDLLYEQPSVARGGVIMSYSDEYDDEDFYDEDEEE